MNWGILSTANIAVQMFMPAIVRSQSSNLTAIASRDLKKAESVAGKFDIEPIEGYENLLNRTDIDIVYNPLPSSMHFEWTMKALDAGKHVFLEKPAACSYMEIQEMVTKAKKSNLTLIENFHYKFHSQHTYVKQLIGDGTIGEVRSFKSSFGVPPFNDCNNIRYHKNLGGGALFDVGVYVLNVCTFLFGNAFEISGVSLTNNETLDINWYGDILLHNYDQNFGAQLSFGFDNYYKNEYEIWGSEGVLSVTRAFTPKPDFQPTVLLNTKEMGRQELVLDTDDQYRKAIDHFVSVVSNGTSDKELEKIMKQAQMVNQVLNFNNA